MYSKEQLEIYNNLSFYLYGDDYTKTLNTLTEMYHVNPKDVLELLKNVFDVNCTDKELLYIVEGFLNKNNVV